MQHTRRDQAIETVHNFLVQASMTPLPFRVCNTHQTSLDPHPPPPPLLPCRYEAEEGAAVMYCYELQLVEQVRRRGLGPRLMELLEVLAASAGMSRVMLTVMSENEAALRMYARLGYSLDDSSPGIGDPRDDSGYRIMSKQVQGQVADAVPAAAAAGADADASVVKSRAAGCSQDADVQQQRDVM